MSRPHDLHPRSQPRPRRRPQPPRPLNCDRHFATSRPSPPFPVLFGRYSSPAPPAPLALAFPCQRNSVRIHALEQRARPPPAATMRWSCDTLAVAELKVRQLPAIVGLSCAPRALSVDCSRSSWRHDVWAPNAVTAARSLRLSKRSSDFSGWVGLPMTSLPGRRHPTAQNCDQIPLSQGTMCQ
jgi:hypothetical protein